MIILPIHEHDVCFHYSLWLFQFLSSVSYNFPNADLLSPWLHLFLGTLFFVVAIVNGIIFLVSLSDTSLLVCKNAINFWILTLYSATLLNSFIRSSSFLVDYRFSMYNIMLSDNITTVLLTPFNLNAFNFSFCVTPEARTYSTMLNQCVKAHTPVLFLILRETCLVFDHWVWCWQ